ncbi:hypothetical protein H0H93_009334 [Arthromyces matolae]|nr:hypothetical protein H0H93_009334 [Arthromyces matolae]
MEAMNPLLPDMTQSNFVKLVENSFTSEGYINGVWGSILNYRFKDEIRNGSKLLSPEVDIKEKGSKKPKKGGFTDYVLESNTYSQSDQNTNDQILERRLVIVFEGKRAKPNQHTGNWKKALEQAFNYAKTKLIKGQICVIIVAIGTQVKFWNFHSYDKLYAYVEGLYIEGDDIWAEGESMDQTPFERPQGPPLSLITDADKVKKMLDAIEG